MRVEELSGRLAPRHQVHVVGHQRGRIQERQKAVDDHGEWYPEVADGLAEGHILLILVYGELPQRGADEVHGEKGGRRHEGKEVSVVPPPDTVVNPNAMVVLGFHAVVTDAAMMGSGRPPEVTRLTVLRGDLHRCRA